MTTAKMQFVSSEIEVGPLRVTLLKREDRKDEKRLVSKIRFNHRLVFRFDPQNYQGQVAVMLCELDGHSYALTLYGQRLIDVYDIATMSSWQMVGVEEGRPVFEGRSMKDAIELRFHIADRFKLEPILTKNEQAVANWITAKKKEAERRAEEEARAAAQQEREAEEAARKERRRQEVSRILARRIARGFTSAGRMLPGAVPVVKDSDEWLKLRDGTFCVEVEYYDHETRTHGAFGRHFCVSKKGHARKTQVCDFFVNPEKCNGIELVGSCTIEVNNEPVIINLYTDKSLQPLLESGLNSGKLVGVPLESGQVQLYRFSRGGFQEEGVPVERLS